MNTLAILFLCAGSLANTWHCVILNKRMNLLRDELERRDALRNLERTVLQTVLRQHDNDIQTLRRRLGE